MARCCGSGCTCKIEAGTRVTITGIGSPNDPFVVSADSALTVSDTDVIDLTISGSGTTASPWVLTAGFASTAELGDIPDVAVVGRTNGQVLGWDSSLNKWTPRAPTTASAGAVQHDTSMTGDGSAGSPLQIVEDPNGGLATTASGLGLNDGTKRQLVRSYTSDANRNAASPAPVVNSLSVVTARPGQVDYWTGSEWQPVRDRVEVDGNGQQLLALSGAYAGTGVTMMVRNFTGITAADGTLTVLPSALLSGRAGVLSAQVQITGSQPYLPMLAAGSNYLYVTARRVNDGAVLAGQAITGQITAYVY